MTRCARWLAVLLLLGAIVNVVVSWGCVYWVYTGVAWRAGAGEPLGGGEGQWYIAVYEPPGAMRVHSIWGAVPWPSTGIQVPPVADLIKPGRLPIEPAASWHAPAASIYDARGWPWPSMWSSQTLSASVTTAQDRPVIMPGAVARVRSGVALSIDPRFRVQGESAMHQHRVLPMGIVWWAFIANTLAYAMTLGLIVALYRGARGLVRRGARRCPRCGYDLRETRHDRCPECGCNRPGIGEPSLVARTGRRAVFAAAALLVLIAGGAVIRFGWPHVTAYDWNAHKPASWLTDTACENDDDAPAALDELIERLEADTLPEDEIRVLIDAALERQASPDGPWHYQWADLLFIAHDKGRLNAAEWTRFLDQCVVAELLARDQILRGDRPSIAIRLHKRVSSRGGLVLAIDDFDARFESLRIGRHKWACDWRHVLPPRIGLTYPPFTDIGVAGNRGGLFSLTSVSRVIDAAPGHHAVTAAFAVTIHEGPVRNRGPALHRKAFELSRSVEVLPADATAVEVVDDERLRPEVTRAVRLDYFTVDDRDVNGRPDPTTQRVRVQGRIEFTDPPLPLAFDVIALVNGKAFPLGQIDNEKEHAWQFPDRFTGHLEIQRGDRVDLVLRSSREAARRTFRMTRIWGGDLVLDDIDVRWRDAGR